MNTNFSISIFSDYNFLAISILENLLSKNCYINVLTRDVKTWNKSVSHIASNKHFAVLDRKKNNGLMSAYSIILLGFNNEDPYVELHDILKNNSTTVSKTLVILPFEKYSFEENSRFNFSGNLGVIYLGDLLGPRMDFKSNLLINRLLKDIYFKKIINMPVGEVLYPTDVADTARTVCRWLFSFGPYGKETLLFGTQTSATNFWKENMSLVGDVDLSFDTDAKFRIFPKGIDIKQNPINLRYLLTETYRWQESLLTTKNTSSFEFKISKTITKKKVYPKYLKPLVWGLSLVLLFPILLQLISLGFFYFSYKQFINGKDDVAQNSILIGKTLSVISKEESGVLWDIPIIGLFYKELYFVGLVEERTSDIAVTSMPLIRNSSDMANKMLGNEIYDPAIYAANITVELNQLYGNLSLLQTDTVKAISQRSLIAKFLMKKINLEKIINLTYQMEKLSQNLPNVLGKDGRKSYLVLFQNNMELRPTGGFIGSFGILTFEGGRISDLTINDVYSADGQLNGHVEPPAALRKYLGEANWWLRDSNWDPDFPTSARRAEWFLDKEMARSVDGVVSTDLQMIKDILKHTGPIFLSDFNMDIMTENLYQKTQAEVQDNFFPGTHKKASFLTALSRGLLANIAKLETDKKLGVLRSFYTDLTSRSIQIFLHDDNVQNPITAMGWDGGVNIPDCGTDCYPDLIGTVEANVGFNKSNYFVERNQSVQVNLTPDRIERTLTLVLKNNANPALGVSGTYKTYVRLLSDGNSETTSVKLYTGETPEDFTSEVVKLKGRNETGAYIEVLGGQTKVLQFSWSTNLESSSFDKYGIYLRKQGGVDAYPVSLTVKGNNIYNDILAGDYFSRINW